MNSTLIKDVKKVGILLLSGMLLTVNYMVYAPKWMIIKPETELIVKDFFSAVVEILGFIFQYFSFPAITLFIFFYALFLFSKSRENKVGFVAGIAIASFVIYLVHKLHLSITLSSEISPSGIFLCSIVALVFGIAFLYLMEKLAGRPISALFIAFMASTSLSSLVLYYSQDFEPLQAYLFSVTIWLLIGGCIFEIAMKKRTG